MKWDKAMVLNQNNKKIMMIYLLQILKMNPSITEINFLIRMLSILIKYHCLIWIFLLASIIFTKCFKKNKFLLFTEKHSNKCLF